MSTKIKDLRQERIPLKLLEAMPNNRVHGSGMSTKSIAEIAASIVEVGIRQNLTVRKHPDPEKSKKGMFQILIGARRHVAAQKAAETTKVDDAPCNIVECDDVTALEIRSIENLQREGLHELEEAAQYQALLDLRDPAGKALHTWETLAQRVGKSVAYIRARVKLLRMPDLAKKAFLNGRLPASHALFICRIPDPKDAHKATVEILDRYSGKEENAHNKDVEVMSYRQAKEHVGGKYMRRLKEETFDQEDETLVPLQWQVRCGSDAITVTSASPITLPPKGVKVLIANHEKDKDGKKVWLSDVFESGKSSANGGVALQIGKADAEALAGLLNLAGDKPVVIERVAGGACSSCPFRTGNMKGQFPEIESADVCTSLNCLKAKRIAAQKKEEAKFAAKGQTLLKPKESANLLTHEGELHSGARAGVIPLNEQVPGKRNQTWGEFLEKNEIAHDVVVAKTASSAKSVPLVPITPELTKAIKDAGVKFQPPKSDSEDSEKEQAERKFRIEVANHATPDIVEAYSKAIRLAKNAEDVRAAVLVQATQHGESPLTVKAAKKLDDREAFAVLFENHISMRPFTHYHAALDDDAVKLCAELGVDLKAIVKDAEKAVKEAAKEPAKPDAKK